MMRRRCRDNPVIAVGMMAFIFLTVFLTFNPIFFMQAQTLRSGPLQIFIMDEHGNHRVVLTQQSSDCLYPQWSPDGKYILFTVGYDPHTQIYVMDADGENLTFLAENTIYYVQPAWSPDSKRIAFVSGQTDKGFDLFSVDTLGQHTTKLTDGQFSDLDAIGWSPDGKHLAIAATRANASVQNLLYIMDSDGENLAQITEKSDGRQALAWSPDSKQIAFISFYEDIPDLYTIDIDGKHLTKLTHSVLGEMGSKVVWSPDGKHIALSGHAGDINVTDIYQSSIFVVDADGKNVTEMTKGKFFYSVNPAWSPNSKRIVFNNDEGGTTQDTGDIYVVDFNGKNLTALTHNESGSRMPAWSPDGKHIAFAAPSKK